MRLVRVYHGGRDPSHRARERALARAGVEVTLLVPSAWPGPDDVAEPRIRIVELDVRRPGDVNRHAYVSPQRVAAEIEAVDPDVVDVHEEPFSAVAHQLLPLLGDRKVVMYSAQNLDKRFPPPFAQWERQALARVDAFYPCSRQAASVLRGKGFTGTIAPIPLGLDLPHEAEQGTALGFVGRLTPEKGLLDAIEVAARTGRRLLVVGEGPDEGPGRALAEARGADVEWHPWLSAQELAVLYRRMSVVLIPSRATPTWVEQFGRVITEAWAHGAVPVGYASGSIPEVMAGLGVLVAEGDVRGLASAVEDLSPSRLRKLRVSGLAAVQQLSWDRVAEQLLDLYDAPPTPHQAGRAAAHAEFGLPARTPVSTRPFALPVLRTSRSAHRLVGS